MPGAITWQRVRQWGGNLLFTLFILTVMLDPTNTVLGLKSKAFALVVAYNVAFFRPSFKFLPHIVIVIAAVTISYILAVLQGNSPDMDTVVDSYLAFAPLLLLLWVHHYDVVRLSLFPAICVALVVVCIFAASSYDERLEGAIYYFMKQHDHMVMMTHRYLMGVKVFGIYYKSFVCLMFALFYYYYHLRYAERHKWLYALPAALFTFAFFLSGTRATMVFPFFMMVVVGYQSVVRMRAAKYVFYPVLLIGVICFLGLVLMLAMERGEESNAIKYAHLTSYKELFVQHPLYILLGQGVGTRFYSAGFHRLTFTSEWTYLELIRQYGVFCVLILITLLYPFRMLWRFRKESFILGAMCTYSAYLLVAGTNPLLFSSTGMHVLLCFYSVASRRLHTAT